MGGWVGPRGGLNSVRKGKVTKRNIKKNHRREGRIRNERWRGKCRTSE